ncbi:MAG: hypothetical protein WCH65_05890 [bacterium]
MSIVNVLLVILFARSVIISSYVASPVISVPEIYVIPLSVAHEKFASIIVGIMFPLK